VKKLLALSLGFVLTFGSGCSRDASDGELTGEEKTPPAVGQEDPYSSELLSSVDDLPESIQRLLEPWTGDLDGMTERRVVRLLTVFSPMYYFLDGPRQRGIVYETATEFEKSLNTTLGRKRLKVQVIIVPVPREQLIPALVEGRGDIAAANLTITPERAEVVDFSIPIMRGVSEIVVTGPAAPRPASLADLAGETLRLRRESSYWESIDRLNGSLVAAGKDPVRPEAADPHHADEDLLEMVNAGMLPMTIIDDHKARAWSGVFEEIVLHPDLAVRTGGEIAWAIRKDSPRLAESINAFIRKHREGTLFGNVVYDRYLGNVKWVENAHDPAGRERFREMEALFKEYGERYSIDWLLLAAQAYQGSRLDQSKRSRRGAVGVMQLMPAAAKQVGISGIDQLENNIHAGVKYMRHIMDHYLADEGLDPTQRSLLALAGYNAGPSRIKRLRHKAKKAGLDPNVWFDNVEVVTARAIGSEPVRYVGNIAKYYVAYKMIELDRGS
jgi:membrane-bound lytic murein transglycosylase MltF